jgi:hypothetical protein
MKDMKKIKHQAMELSEEPMQELRKEKTMRLKEWRCMFKH